MTSESDDSARRRWLVEPPGSGTINFQIAAGEQAEVTPEMQQAFNSLLEALEGVEVEGYVVSECHAYKKGCTTNTFSCTPRRVCTAEVQQPCFMDYHCVIAP